MIYIRTIILSRRIQAGSRHSLFPHRKLNLALYCLTIGRPDAHVAECDEAGALNDNLDRLLSVRAANVAISFRGIVSKGSLKCEVV